MRFACGHEDHEDRTGQFGRGQARRRRLAEWYGRPCLVCALAALAARERSLTCMDGRPLPEERIRQRIAERRPMIERRYL